MTKVAARGVGYGVFVITYEVVSRVRRVALDEQRLNDFVEVRAVGEEVVVDILKGRVFHLHDAARRTTPNLSLVQTQIAFLGQRRGQEIDEGR